MWVFIILAIQICGYIKVSKNQFLKYNFKKSQGWQSYFIVAEQGVKLMLECALLCISVLLYLCLFIILTEIPYSVIFENFSFDILISNLENSYVNIKEVFTISYQKYKEYLTQRDLVYVFLFLSLLYAYGLAEVPRKSSNKGSIEVEQKIADSNPLEFLIYESVKKGLLIMVTLTSRKVYVGQVLSGRIGHTDSDNIIIIPILSGYRDKNTLRFKVEHNYSEYYDREGISESSDPSKSQFKQALFFEFIESISLFDTETYKKFQEGELSSEIYDV